MNELKIDCKKIESIKASTYYMNCDEVTFHIEVSELENIDEIVQYMEENGYIGCYYKRKKGNFKELSEYVNE